jgi:hypothetical protein
MPILRTLLILLFAVSVPASAVASWRMPHGCCHEPACTAQCPAMQCGAASLAIAPPPAALALAGAEPVEKSRQVAMGKLPSTVEEIWIPPD